MRSFQSRAQSDRERDYHEDRWVSHEEVMRDVRTFDSKDITYNDNCQEIMDHLYNVTNDVITRCGYKELGQTNIN